MAQSEQINRRAHEIGREIFEHSRAAQYSIWHKAWWLDRLMRVVERDERLKTRAFAFVDCLPSLSSHAEITRHLREYLDPKSVELPAVVQAALGDGVLRRLREDAIGWMARVGAEIMASRFITGYDLPSVIKTFHRLREQDMAFTLDVLGEFTTSDVRADEYAHVYHDLMDQLTPVVDRWPVRSPIDGLANGVMPRVNLSVKLTGLDPHFDAIDPERSIRAAGHRLRPLLRHARQVGAFLNIDMESFRYRDITLDLFQAILMEDEFRDFVDVGIVVQAYLTDAEIDLTRLLEWGRRRGHRFAVRLVKGAYWDAEMAAAVRNYQSPPVWTHKWESDACFERMARVMLQHVHLIRPAFASHNVRSLAATLATAEELGVAPGQFEIQMLYGMGDPLKTAMVRLGQCVRVYCPYGDLMPGMGYLIRRLLENTSNDSFLKQSFSDRSSYDRLLADPDLARPPSAPLPKRRYQNTDPEEPMLTFQNTINTNFAKADNREKFQAAIQTACDAFGREYPMWLDGKPVSSREVFDSMNPSRRTEIVGQVALAGITQVDQAVAAARRAFGSWRNTPARERAARLRGLADMMETRRFDLAATIVLEVGKPWQEADADVTEAIDHSRYYAQQIERMESRPRIRNLPGEDNKLIYAPKGVCAIISPFAFPLAILAGMTTAALAAGNTVVIKPARKASVVAAKFVELFRDLAFPPGVVNLLFGDGATVGPHLVEHGDVNLVAFTGSHAVGTQVIRAGANTRPGQAFIRKMIVEMGGKNAVIVDDDADLDAAVGAVAESAFAFAGQKCSSCSRLIVLNGVYETVLDRLAEAAASLRMGPADAPATIVGPVIDENAQTRIEEYVELGKKEGRMIASAALPSECNGGFFVPPTIFADVSPDARIAQEEILGPVLAVIKAANFDQAIAMANNTRYALTGGLFSRSPSRIEQACREFAVGNLYINRRITGSQVDAQPFGGFRLSGTGVKAGSPDYLAHFMDARCITENTLRSGLVPVEELVESV